MGAFCSRFGFFTASFCMTMGSSLAAMQGGFDFRLMDLINVPAICWLLSIGAGVIGALDSKVILRRRDSLDTKEENAS